MAFSLSTNLKLRLDSNLTANAKYNLLKLDELGGVYSIDNSGTVRVRSKMGLLFSANDAALGGLGEGGTVSFGAPGNRLSEFSIHADKVSFDGGIALIDEAAQDPTLAARLSLAYKSDQDGTLDSKDVSLSLDLGGQDRAFLLGGDLRTSGNIQLSGPANLQLPQTGTLATLAGTETFTNKTIDLRYNKVIGLTPAALDANFLLSGASIDPTFGSRTVQSGGIQLQGPSYKVGLFAAPAGQTTDLQFTLPSSAGKQGQFLATDGRGTLSWYDLSQTGYITSVASPGAVLLSVQNQQLTGDFNIHALDPSSQPAPQDELVLYNQLAAKTQKTSVQNLLGMAQFSWAGDWLSGNVFTVAHQLASLDVHISCYDKATGASFIPDSVLRLDQNTVQLTASQFPPAGGWRVVVLRSGLIASQNGGTLGTPQSTLLNAVSLTTDLNEFIVGGSGLSSEGTISLTLDTAPQSAGTVWAGPVSGDLQKPGFRRLTAADFQGVIGQSGHFVWNTSDGEELTIQHNWGTRNIIVQLMDNLSYQNVDGPTVSRIDLNTVIISADTPPSAGGWTVLLQSVV
jgi:hypothetical protein